MGKKGHYKSINLESLVKDYRKEIVDEFPRLSEENPNTLGDTFEVFIARQVFGPIFSMSNTDIDDCFDLSKKNEQSMDLAFLPYPNELHLMEVKWRTGSKSVDHSWIDKIANTPSFLINDIERDKLPEFIKEKLEDFDPKRKINEVFIYLVTNCGFSDGAKEKWDLITSEAQEKYKELNLTFRYIDHNGVYDEYQRAQTTEELPTVKMKKEELKTQENNRFFDLSSLNDGNKEISLCVVSGTEVNDWVQQHKNLFHENIRGYRGKNIVNKELLKTINDEPESFLTFNNGLTATSTEINQDDQSITMNKFQIINGCQTANTIHDYYKNAYKDSEGEYVPSAIRIQNLKNLRVLVRIVEVDSTASDTGTKAKLIRANNTQTPLKYHDFRSTDKVQVNIENFINKQKRLNYRGISGPKTVRYVRKTQSSRKKKDELICKLTDLAEDVYSFEHESFTIYSNTKNLYDDEINGNNPGKYWQIFGDDDGSPTETLSNLRITQMFGIHFICLNIREEIALLIKDIEKGTSEYNLYYLKRIYSSLFGYFLRKILDEENANKIINDAFNGTLFSNDDNANAIKNIIINIRSVINYRFKLIQELGMELQIKNFARQEKEFNKLIETGEDAEYLPQFEQHFNALIN